MPLLKRTIVGLINGVSRQPDILRLDSQGGDQRDCVSDVSDGVRRRPPIQQIATYGTSDLDVQFLGRPVHWFKDADGTVLRFSCEDSGGGDAEVIDEDGNQFAVTLGTGATSYLTNVDESMRFVTVGDDTYVVNPNITPALTATTSADEAGKYAAFRMKTAVNGAKINCIIDHPSAGNQVSTLALPGTGVVDTNNEVRNLAAQIIINWGATTPAITAATLETVDYAGTSYANACIFRFADGTDFDLVCTDGFGDAVMQALKERGTVQAFGDLPARWFDSFRLAVQGDPESTADIYYVQFEMDGVAPFTTTNSYAGATKDFGDGVWKEIVKWGLKTEIDPATMPFRLWKDGATWKLDPVDWADRLCGDDDSNPQPSFIGVPITDIFFHKNRLGLVAGENVVLSGVGDFTNFWRTTVTSQLDDDPIDISASTQRVSNLLYAQPFDDAVVLFPDSGPLLALRSDADIFSSQTVEIDRITGYSGTTASAPVFAGDRIFFAETTSRGANVYEVYLGDGNLFVVDAITEHIDDFIQFDQAPALAADGVNGRLVIFDYLNTVSNELYVYEYFFSNREKVQSSWHRWTMHWDGADNQVWVTHPGAFFDGVLYFTSQGFVQSQAFLHKVDWETNESDQVAGSGQVYFSDNLFVATVISGGVFGATQGIIVPGWLSSSVGASNHDRITLIPTSSIPSVGTRYVPFADGAVSGGDASVLGVTEHSSGTYHQETRISFSPGVWSAGQTIAVGLQYNSAYVFTNPIQKDRQGAPLEDGRHILRRFKVLLKSAIDGALKTVVGSKTRTYSFTDRLKPSAPVHVDREDAACSIEVSGELDDMRIVGVNWEYEYHPQHTQPRRR